MSTPIDSTDEVLSGEAVAIDVQPLGFFMRALGALIDMAIGWGLLLLFLWLRTWLLFIGVIDDSVDGILNITALVVCFVAVPVVVELALRGRSVGKLAVGGRIVRVDGGAAGFRHAFIRALVGVLEVYMTFGAVAILAGAFTARSQRLGDLIAGTYSQRVRTPKLIPLTPVMPTALSGWAEIADVARMPDRLARRISQFLQHAERMSPQARARVARDLVTEASTYISPQPVAHPEQLLIAITVLRRERERRALAIADAKAERLTGRRVGV
ncbi:putative RDD family membrane protein YckC [Microbacterium ginsengiterrae]|uniref:Putative RDD family membrane protein YckC n=1 Tax=Microbacterium ginsengiterrae TaxID=546115 RepID=A0A7W9FBV7_9MICO|nr:RDD family protein [Microbacterium ginsengiterrae]MBB5743756.1 putative RDD family membrane protein YckC [Microbacterium ginsengiterrae]